MLNISVVPQHSSLVMIEVSVLSTTGSPLLPEYMGSLPVSLEVMMEKDLVILEKGASSEQT